MAKQLSTEILIHASPEKIWAALTAFEQYHAWNPFIRSLTGTPAVGGRITVRLEPPGGKGMTFQPKVLAFAPGKEFRWRGNLLFPGLFDGEHIFELIDNGDGTTTFRQRELFSGVLVPLFKKMLEGSTKAGFEAMNRALKNYVESGH
jgi:hypothetical protein